MSSDTVASNYNDVGSIIMERIYGHDYLSPGGTSATALLVELGEIRAGEQLLDAGSGLGGAACYLAEQTGCSVQGLDLMSMNVTEAIRRAQARALSTQLSFVCGDVTAVPFPDNSFDVVYGQDAWCHVDHKQKMLAEFARVLVPGGRLVFSDWLIAQSANAANAEIRRVAASPNMADVATYHSLLQDEGFELIKYVNTSAEITQRYVRVLAKLTALRAEICTDFSEKVFEIVRSKQQLVLAGFESQQLETGSFVAVALP